MVKCTICLMKPHVKHITLIVFILSLIIGLIFFIVNKQSIYATPLTGADSDVSIFQFYDFSYVDDTTDANDADATDDGGNGGSDIKWGMSGADKMYMGSTAQFERVYVDVTGAGYGAGGGAFPITGYYWDGSQWATLSITSNPFGSTGIGYFSFTAPGDWATTSVNGSSNYYYIYIGAGTQGSTVKQISLLSVGGGGPATPEFSTWMYLITLCMGSALVYKMSKPGYLGSN